jgi:hypothetical protein
MFSIAQRCSSAAVVVCCGLGNGCDRATVDRRGGAGGPALEEEVEENVRRQRQRELTTILSRKLSGCRG